MSFFSNNDTIFPLQDISNEFPINDVDTKNIKKLSLISDSEGCQNKEVMSHRRNSYVGGFWQIKCR